MHLFSPVSLNKVVSFEDRFNTEVVLLISFVKKTLLYDGELAFQNTKKTRIDRCNANFLPYLQVLVKEYFLTDSPTYIDTAQCYLIIHGTNVGTRLL